MIADDSTLETEQETSVDLSDCRVLVVDDTPSGRQLMSALLGAAGVRTIEFARDGAEGLAEIEKGVPDLVIFDIAMPDMDGAEFCRRLRADERLRQLPLLAVTARDGAADRSAIFRAGATDFITTPIHGAELIARVRSHLENRLLIRSLQEHVKLMQWELELARYMQENLLPRPETLRTIAATTGLSVSSHFQPSSELGGDLWAVHPFGDGRTGVSIVDFAGHGLAAALNTFRLHALMSEILPDPADPAGFLTLLNEGLVELLPSGQFATMFFAVIDSRQGVLTFAAAGSPKPVVANHDVSFLDSSGLPLGITTEARYENRKVPFPEGSVLLLYSDALTESADRSGHCLGLPDLAAMVAAGRQRDSGAPMGPLLSRFLMTHAPIVDDLTVLWLRQGPLPL
ncbi:fused response regulator/phosphatase [Telmatospirillum sp.]|uniref:PP2C family protein-serine/threonine phosphatase n=1 Tax=Telmatospirillum sp. TaxID=2079197 RepID=UPI002850A958|nr:fused response regulator/phosphatase [Telmatospirillum sp.]MDR3437482.1 fused response regulator/phosphatase [Telmatospirillum sp.]